MMIENRTLLSIIVPTYDLRRLKDVKDLLESITTQTYGLIETLLVTESPSYGQKLRQLVDDLMIKSTVVLVNEELDGVNASRNHGIMNAKGCIICLLDDDVVLDRDWARNVVETHMLIPRAGAATGPVLPLWVGKPAKWIPASMYWLVSCTGWDWKGLTLIRNVGGMNSSYDKKTLLQTTLFDPTIGPKNGGAKAGKVLYIGAEEVDICHKIRRNGKLIVYNPRIIVYHKIYESYASWRSLTKRAVHFGFTRGYIARNLSGGRGSPLSFEINHLRLVLISLLPGVNKKYLSLSGRLRMLMLYPITMVALLAGYFCYFVLG